MDASPSELRALLALVLTSLAGVIFAVVVLVRRGAAVPPPVVWLGRPQRSSRRPDHVSDP